MQIDIKETDIKLGEALKEWIVKEILKLEKFKDLLKDELWKVAPSQKEKSKVHVWVEVGKSTFHHKEGKVYRAEIQIRLPKKSFRAVVLNDDLRIAVTNARKKIERQISDFKDLLVDREKHNK